MSGHEEQRAHEEAMQLGTEILLPPTHLPLFKLIRDCLDATQLSALIKEKANTELEYATALGELKVFYPCPVKSCPHNKANGINSFRNKNKRPAESPIQPATLIYILNNNSKKSNKSNQKSNSKQPKNPAKKTRQEPKNSEDNIIPTKNSFASLAIEDPTDVENENDKPIVEDIPESNDNNLENEDDTVTPKIKPIMLRYKMNYNLILKELDKKYPKAVNKLTGPIYKNNRIYNR
ncbi:hypothetical protein TNCV_385321 [Trichonephila clavipes]|nr:hypothetical protein TNCV_385321 [Trichonephila clavipes]